MKDWEKALEALTAPRAPIGPSYAEVRPALDDAWRAMPAGMQPIDQLAQLGRAVRVRWPEMTASAAMFHAQDFLAGR